MAEAGQQQQPGVNGTDGASTTAAASQPVAADSQQQMQDGGRKSKQPIKYVPPKPASGNPNFAPRKAWPGGSITVRYPKNAPPPGTHRWKGNSSTQLQSQAGRGGAHAYTSQHFGSSAPQRSSRLRTASSGHGGGIDMHSAIALQLQSAPGGRACAQPRSGPGAGTGSLNGRSGQNGHLGGSSEAPEPGEVPAGPRRHAQSLIAGECAAASTGAHAAAGGRGSGLAQLYKQQGGGSLLEAMAQRRSSGGSPARSSPGPGGGGGGGNPVFRRPSGGSPAFKEGFSIANKLLAALEQNAGELAASHAAVIAAYPAGEEGNSLRLGFKSRIRSQQQEFADDEAYVAELNEYLAAASNRAGTASGADIGAAAAKDSFSFGVDSAGFGSSISVGTPDDAWAASDSRRGVGVLRHGSRRVERVGGTDGERQVLNGGDSGGAIGIAGGDSGMGSSFKGFKRKAQWQSDSAAASSRKVVAMSSDSGFGSGSRGGGVSKFVKPAAAKAQLHAFKKQPAAAAQRAPASVEAKLGMSLDAIAGKPGNSKPVQRSAVRAAAGGSGGGGGAAASAAGGAAADGGSRKHKPIAWGA